MQYPLRLRASVLLSVIFVFALVLGACAPAAAPQAAPAEAPAAEGGQTLVIANDLDVTGLDPAVIYDLTTRVVFLLYEGLIALEADSTTIVPALAESWEISEDGLTYTFHLRPGVTFHDGTPLTADAVEKSLDRFIAIGKTTAYLFNGVLSEINVVDDATVEMKLAKPFAPFLSLLASSTGPLIISPTVLDENAGDDMAQGYLFDHAVGTGPYRLESWDPGQQTITLVKNDEYWQGWEGDHIDRVIFRYVVETSTRKLMLEQGEVDIAYGLSPDELESLAGAEGVVVDEAPTMRIFYVNMNNQKGPLQDVRVRQALSYVMDYDGVRDFVFNGKLERLCGPLPPNDPNSLPCDQFPYTLDMDKAKALLAEAGYADGGFTLEATVMEGDSAFRRTAEILQAQLAELNIQVNLTEMAWTTMWEQIGSLETAPDLIPIRNYPDYADSTSILSAQYNSAAWGSNGWNLAYYKNEEFDRMIEAVNATTDEAERAELFAQMVELVTAEAPLINIGTYVNQVAMRDNVNGYFFNPIYTPVLPVYAMSKD